MLRLLSKPKSVSFYSSLESYLGLCKPGTARAYRSIMRRLAKGFGVGHGSPMAAEKLSLIDVKAGLGFIASLRAAGNADATITQRTAGLIAIWTALKAAGEVEFSPWREIYKLQPRRDPEPVRPTGSFDREQVAKMLRLPDAGRVGTRDRALLALLFGAALRRSEARALTVGDILDRGSVLQISHQKSGGAALQPVAAFAVPYLAAYLKQRITEGATADSPYLVAYTSLFKPTGAISESMTYRLFRHYSSAVGANCAPHAARATAITRLLDKRVPVADVAYFSRHRSTASVLKYDKRAKARVKKNVADKLSF